MRNYCNLSAVEPIINRINRRLRTIIVDVQENYPEIKE